MANNILAQLLTGEMPEDVKEKLRYQHKLFLNRIRREVSDTYVKKQNAKRRAKYKNDPEFRAKIKEYRSKWWANKTPEERRALYDRAKLRRIERQNALSEHELEALREKERQRKEKKYAEVPEYRERLKEKSRQQRANMTREERQKAEQRKKDIWNSLPEHERERRAALQRERCKRYRQKKKLQSISHDQGQDHGARKEHTGTALPFGGENS